MFRAVENDGAATAGGGGGGKSEAGRKGTPDPVEESTFDGDIDEEAGAKERGMDDEETGRSEGARDKMAGRGLGPAETEAFTRRFGVIDLAT